MNLHRGCIILLLFIQGGNSNEGFTTAPTTAPYELDDIFILDGSNTNRDDVVGEIFDPFDNELSPGTEGPMCNVSSKVTYKNRLLIRVLYFPSFGVLIVSTLLLILLILRLIKPLVKIYLSVVFYAISLLYLAGCIIFSSLSNRLYDDSRLSCQVSEPLQAIGIILPGYAVLCITTIRYIFLKYPIKWRNILNMKRQFCLFLFTVLFVAVLCNLPNMGLCGYELYSLGTTRCRYQTTGTSCKVFYGLFIAFGFVVPSVAVICLYIMICRIILAHRTFRKLTTVSTSTHAASSVDNQRSSKNYKSDRNERDENERSRIPWSIIAIMILNVLSTLPWLPQALYPELFFGCKPSEVILLVDILWSVLVVALAASPLTYLLTTPTVREQVIRFVCCRCCHKSYKKIPVG